MRESIFANMINELANYYERKEPRMETIDLWYRKVKQIPDECVFWMSDRIEATHETFPRNLPLVCLQLFDEWKQANPDRIIGNREYRECKYCEDGLIFAKKDVAKGKSIVTYEYVFRCGHCKQDNHNSFEFATYAALERAEYFILNKNKPLVSENKAVSMDNLVQSILK